jgi:hypothetical protein
MADAVIEGKESVPTVAVGEDEFVELDEAGNPRKKAARGGGRPRPQAAVRKKAAARRRPAAVPTPAGVEATELPDVDDDLDVEDPAVAAAVVGIPPVAPVNTDRRPSGGARRGGGKGGGGGRGARD